MTTNSPIAGLPIPEGTDPPNAPAAFLSLATTLDPIVIPRFASASARDLKIPAPSDGQHAYLTDSHALYVYQADTAAWVPYSYAKAPLTTKFANDGTWTKPAGARSVWVRIVGGGGGGGGAQGGTNPAIANGGSGGAGGYAESWYDAADLPASVAITVGAAGSVTVGGAGGAGGNTTFGGLMTANGGAGGGVGTSTTGDATAGAGVGGTATGGTLLNVQGEGGATGQVIGGKQTFYQKGGSSFFGSGGQAAVSAGANGDPANGSGAGGGNGIANTTSRSGGAGTKGLVVITTYF